MSSGEREHAPAHVSAPVSLDLLALAASMQSRLILPAVPEPHRQQELGPPTPPSPSPGISTGSNASPWPHRGKNRSKWMLKENHSSLMIQ